MQILNFTYTSPVHPIGYCNWLDDGKLHSDLVTKSHWGEQETSFWLCKPDSPIAGAVRDYATQVVQQLDC